MSSANQVATKRIVAGQIILGLSCTALFLLVGVASARSALLATVASALPCGYYAWVAARTFSAPRLVLHGVLRSIGTMVLIALAIVVFGIEPLGFFATFVVVQLSYFAPSGNTPANS